MAQARNGRVEGDISEVASVPPVTVLDGGLATTLEELGEDLNSSLWSAALLVDNPGRIREAHEAFVAAGADVILTASYQASVRGFSSRGFNQGDTEEMMVRSVQLAREATKRSPERSRGGREEVLVRLGGEDG